MTTNDNRVANLRLLVDEEVEATDGKLRSGYRAVATATGLDEEYIYQLYKGYKKNVGENAAKSISRAYARGRPSDWFDRPIPSTSETTTRLPVVRAAEEPHAGYVRLPVLAEAAGGDGREPLPEVVQYVDVLESYLHQRLHVNPKTIAVLTARGGSMTGVIEDGDVMFVLPTNEFTNDGIYVLSLDGLVRVKRLSVSMISGMVSIESNDGRQAEHLPLKEVPHRLHIQGRVIGAWSLRKFS